MADDQLTVLDASLACDQAGLANTSYIFQSGTANRSVGIAILQWDFLFSADLSVTAVGEYRACWCGTASDCNSSDFVDVGTFFVNGPTSVRDGETGGPLQGFAGRELVIELRGQGLTLLDQTAVIPITMNCGDAGIEQFILGTGNEGSTGDWATSQQWRRSLAAQGYRVCWCSLRHPSDCDEGIEFETEVGVFYVKDATRQLDSGSGDSLVPVGLEGNASTSSSLGPRGYIESSESIITAVDSSGNLFTYSPLLSVGTIRCSSPGCIGSHTFTVSSGRNCKLSASMYVTDFAAHNERLEWIKVEGVPIMSECRAGRSCEQASEFQCLKDFDITPFIPFQDSMVVSAKISASVDRCAKNGNLLHMTLQLSCQSQAALASGELPNDTVYTDPFGTRFAVEGQGIEMTSLAFDVSVHQCSVGSLCILRLPGWGSNSSHTNRILLVRSYKSCGEAVDMDESDGSSDVISSGTGLLANSTADAESDGIFVLGTPVSYDSDASFAICLGLNPETDTDYQYHMGTFRLIGPDQEQNQNCTAQKDCLLGPFSGQSLSSYDHVALLGFDKTCGVDDRDSTVASNAAQSLTSSLTMLLSANHLPYGGIWRLCFCVAKFGGCDDASDFLSDAGLLFIAGPNDLHQDQACYAGLACTLGPFSGHGLTADDQVAVTSSGCNPAALAGSNISQVNQYGQVALSAAQIPEGSVWVLCYCTAAQGCTTSDFSEVGQLAVRGPSPLTQDMQCQVAEDCAQDFSGYWLSPGDRIAAISLEASCGTGSDPSVLRGASKPVVLSGDRTCTAPNRRDCAVRLSLFGHGSGPGDLPIGGQWRLCYCSSHSSCSSSTSFSVEVGILTVRGPPQQKLERTCIAGLPCDIGNLSSLDMQDSSSLMVLDTCGLPPHNFGFSTSLYLHGWPGGGVSLPSDGESASWGSSSILAAGSRYRLCWCRNASQCTAAENFTVDVGVLHFVGPSPVSVSLGPHPVSQNRTCISGQSCALVGVSGYQTSSSDHFLMMSTCGTDSQLSVLPAVPRELSTVQGGEYRLCWCAAASSCSNTSNFRIDIGSILIQGPSPLSQHKTCLAGYTCSLNVTGIFSQDSDRVMVLDTCASSTVVMRWPNSGRSLVSVGEAYSWGDVVVSSAGGRYRLCWCAAGSSSGERQLSCSAGEDFRVDVGELTLIGPGPHHGHELQGQVFVQQRTCVSGLQCAIHGLTGTHMSNQDKFMVLNTCGHHGLVPRFAGGGFAAVSRSGASVTFGHSTSAGGLYHLCWCSSSSCSLGEDFQVPAAELWMLGPEPLEQDRTCVSGAPCRVFVTGYLSSLDSVAVLDTCGQDHLAHMNNLVERFPQAGVSAVTASGALLSWERISSPGGVYRLCWCSSHSACSGTEDFKTDLGALRVSGPHADHRRTCVSGQTCAIHGIGGQHLAGDAFMVLDTCGSGVLPGLPDAGRAVAGSRGATVSWGLAALSVAGGDLPSFRALMSFVLFCCFGSG